MTRATKAKWAGLVRRWRASGRTAREFSAGEGLNPSTLLWWSSQVGREAEAPASFVEVALPASVASDNVIEIVVREGVRIRVGAGFDAELLRRVVAALEAP